MRALCPALIAAALVLVIPSVKALLFGGGAEGTTSEKTVGGWFMRHARAYYR